MTSLRWLDFDYSEGNDDTGTFDALASVLMPQAAQVEAEITQVLAWAEATFPGRRGPPHEGGEWDADWQLVHEADDGGARAVFALSISGSMAFCEAFRAHVGAMDL